MLDVGRLDRAYEECQSSMLKISSDWRMSPRYLDQGYFVVCAHFTSQCGLKRAWREASLHCWCHGTCLRPYSVLTYIEKVMAVVIGVLKLWRKDVLDTVRTMLHKLMCGYGLQADVSAHSRLYTCVLGVW
jgi:hypothetical protein